MATVIIPETGRGDNPLTIYINGVKYSLPRGEEVTIPDAVAAEIQALGGDLLPVTEEPLSDGAHLPRATASDDGKVAKYVDGKWVPADAGGSSGGGSGGDGGVLVVHGTEEGNSLIMDKTWKEIHDAPFAVFVGMISNTNSFYLPLIQTSYMDDAYTVVFNAGEMDIQAIADSEDDYPVSTRK